MSIQSAFGSYLAQVADVNPDTVQVQLEGGVIFGLSAVLSGDVTFADGRVQQSNFNDYPVLRVSAAPRIETHLVASGESPGGVGVTGTACIQAAVCNAVYTATGKRVRTLPLSRGLQA